MNLQLGSLADWAQAIASTVVLVFIYRQIKQQNLQMRQNDDHEQYRRSWEFVKFCREELRETEREIQPLLCEYDAIKNRPDSPEFKELVTYLFRPRVHIFALLNQLVKRQEVDERVLYGYLEDEFTHFCEIGVLSLGHEEFTRHVVPKISLLITLWGANNRLNSLLFPKNLNTELTADAVRQN